MRHAIDLTGRTYGRLTVIKRAGSRLRGVKNPRKIPCWLCQCTCGNQKVIASEDLYGGHTLSCGCLAKETQKKLLKKANIQFNKKVVDSTGHLKPEIEKNYHPTINTKRQKNNKSGVTGVRREVYRNQVSWTARLIYHGKSVLCSRFAHRSDAIAARLAAEKKYLTRFED